MIECGVIDVYGGVEVIVDFVVGDCERLWDVFFVIVGWDVCVLFFGFVVECYVTEDVGEIGDWWYVVNISGLFGGVGVV